MRPAIWVGLLWGVYAVELALGLFADDLSGWGKVAFLVGGLAVSAVVYHQQVYRPAISVEEDYLGLILDDLFGVLVAKYRARQPGDYELRVSLMRVRHRWSWSLPTLRIDFAHGDFSDAELEQEYRLGAGTWGAALQRREQTYYDSIEAHEHRQGLTATQRKVTDHVNSMLCAPVFRPGEFGRGVPVAVLTLDSADSVRVSGLWDDDARDVALYYAATIGALLR